MTVSDGVSIGWNQHVLWLTQPELVLINSNMRKRSLGEEGMCLQPPHPRLKNVFSSVSRVLTMNCVLAMVAVVWRLILSCLPWFWPTQKGRTNAYLESRHFKGSLETPELLLSSFSLGECLLQSPKSQSPQGPVFGLQDSKHLVFCPGFARNQWRSTTGACVKK